MMVAVVRMSMELMASPEPAQTWSLEPSGHPFCASLHADHAHGNENLRGASGRAVMLSVFARHQRDTTRGSTTHAARSARMQRFKRPLSCLLYTSPSPRD
eukprot:4631306-Alexandrium_andersonii.AAC.1